MRSAKKHRIGVAHVLHVLATFDRSNVHVGLTSPQGKPMVMIVGEDDRGIWIEVGVVPEGDDFTVIHAMPVREKWRR